MASHGAKIYRLDWDKLFYLESKWLDPRKAKWILLSSYVEKLFSWIKLDDGEKSQLYEEYFYFF
jgi:Fe-S cluster assembly scaffold protein SufB